MPNHVFECQFQRRKRASISPSEWISDFSYCAYEMYQNSRTYRFLRSKFLKQSRWYAASKAMRSVDPILARRFLSWSSFAFNIILSLIDFTITLRRRWVEVPGQLQNKKLFSEMFHSVVLFSLESTYQQKKKHFEEW